jgi:SAM-dependent methyltransferase
MRNKRAFIQLQKLSGAYIKLLFVLAAKESGVIDVLDTSKSLNKIKETAGIEDSGLLLSLLELGTSIGQLKKKKGDYALKGALAKACLSPSGDPMYNMIKEMMYYHGDVFRDFSDIINTKKPVDYLAQFSDTVAQSSRIVEPFIKNFIKTAIKSDKPLNILEIGCGSGTYLSYYHRINNNHHGIAIDIQKPVVTMARENVKNDRLDRNFIILHEDIRNPSRAIDGPFDLVTLYQNIYYFTTDERKKLFAAIKERLNPDGRLVIVSLFKQRKIFPHYFDIILRATIGCSPLADINEVVTDLMETGFYSIKKNRLLPGQTFWGIVAKR